MKKKNSVVVINDTNNIYPARHESFEDFETDKCSVDVNGLNLHIYCDGGSLIADMVMAFQHGPLLLALKTVSDHVWLSYQAEGFGWDCAYIRCKNQDFLDQTGEMAINVILMDDLYYFERTEILPEEFANALRSAVLKNLSSSRFVEEGEDALTIVDDPDIACVIQGDEEAFLSNGNPDLDDRIRIDTLFHLAV